jgi:fructose-bisphosphate aldolase class I
MDRFYPDITDDVREKLSFKGLKAWEPLPLVDWINPHSNTYWLTNTLIFILNKFKEELMKNAKQISRSGHGILAADESTGTIGTRFKDINVENIEENRRAYRELLFTAPGLEKFISGIILFEETLYQKTASGTPFADLLNKLGILIGIKVDKGVVEIGGTEKEVATQGLDDLGKRAAKYYADGARFSKWRAVIRIGKGMPSNVAIKEISHGLARYAVICQENGLVPIVEPEILVDGTHTIDECAEISERVFAAVVKECQDQKLFWEGALLKPNMITPGSECPTRVSAKEIGWKTVRTLLRTLPGACPGVTFLSGGQSEGEATENLNEMNKVDVRKPWNLSFSYGRALQYSVLRTWLGKKENVEAAQKTLLQLAENNSLATLGKYQGGTASHESLHVKDYVY